MKSTIAIAATLSIAWVLNAAAARADNAAADRIESPVFQTAGTHQEIAKRAAICIAQVVRPGFTTAPVIASTDPDAGIVVAVNEFVYSRWTLLPAGERARTTLTFEAKDGRFRIVHTNIEAFSEPHGSTATAWERIGAGSDGANKVINATTQSIARCVQQGPDSGGNW